MNIDQLHTEKLVTKCLLSACIFHNACFIQLPLTFFKIGTFIMLFLPFATPIFTLHRIFPVQRKRDDSITFTINTAIQ